MRNVHLETEKLFNSKRKI